MEEKLSKRELQILLEILKEGRVSDQEIARRLKTSRPGIALIRKKLENKGIILGYFPLIDFKKIGLDIQAITTFNWKDFSKQEELEEIKDFLRKNPSVIAEMESAIANEKTHAIMSLHTDIKQLEKLVKKIREKGKSNIENIEVMATTINEKTKINTNSPCIDKIENELYPKLILPKK